jgi:hypothetical protein
MDKIAHLPAKQRAELFNETSSRTGIPVAIVEKDFWVCWVLRYLFNESAVRNNVIFKGGTSLSKVFNIIERFSEDIDLILDWRLLGYSHDEPWKERSKNQQDKLNKAINQAADKYINETFIPMLQKDMVRVEHLTVEKAAEQAVRIEYARAFEHEYIRPEVLLEIGPLALWTPHDSYMIKPYAAESFPNVFDDPNCPVKAINAERTFWEKATILHLEAHRKEGKQPPVRYSRHYYDLYKMSGTEVRLSALQNMELLTTVVEFKSKFYPCNWARYADAKPGTLKLVPSEHSQAILRADYQNMREMIFGVYPTFDQILEGLDHLEGEINGTT